MHANSSRKHQRDPFILVVGFVEPHSPYNGPLNDEHPLDQIDSMRQPRFLRAKIFRCVIV
jgi:hypothetical protein